MHEAGIVKMIIRTVEGIKQVEKFATVEKIVLEVGELSGVVPSYLEACYPAAVHKTFMQDTELEIEVVPGMARCLACNQEFRAYENDFSCPACSNTQLEALNGKDIMIKQIMVGDKVSGQQ